MGVYKYGTGNNIVCNLSCTILWYIRYIVIIIAVSMGSQTVVGI